MTRLLLILLLADTSGHPAPPRSFPDVQFMAPIFVSEGSSDELLACAKGWQEALGYGRIVGLAGGNPG